ncbi:MAG: ABC transporter ATP-binding protein [Clostridia bacterium]|nr:ABC transporter ATP-binding protein [Clostridia bacterium]
MKNKDIAKKWFFKNVKSSLSGVFVLTVISILINVFGVGFAVSSQRVLDVASKTIGGSLIKETTILFLLIVLQLVLQIILSKCYVNVQAKARIKIKTDLFHSVVNKDLTEVNFYHSGELVNRLSSDVNVVSSAVVDIIPTALALGISVCLSFAVLFAFDSVYAVIYLIVAPLALLTARIFRKKLKVLHKESVQTDGTVKSFMQECFRNLLVIKAFEKQKHVTDKCNAYQLANYKVLIKKNDVSILANVMFFLSITAGYYLTLIWGAYKLSLGLLTIGEIVAMLELVSQIQSPLKSLSSLFPQYYSAVASSERILELENLPDEKHTENHNKISGFSKIVIDNVSFTYDEKPVFDGASCEIEKGDIVGIYGESGIGKSTLIKLILGVLNAQQGEIYIVDQDGQRVLVDTETRSLFSYVPQGNLILSGTIAENVAFGSDNIDIKLVEHCIKVSQLDEMVSQLPLKLDTGLGEGGLGLSEGQVQRLSIARALYRNSEVLLLDEATSALDRETEIRVLEEIKRMNKTCLFITHRKEALGVCSKLLSVKGGKVSIDRQEIL